MYYDLRNVVLHVKGAMNILKQTAITLHTCNQSGE
jgi:hypothetical protein